MVLGELSQGGACLEQGVGPVDSVLRSLPMAIVRGLPPLLFYASRINLLSSRVVLFKHIAQLVERDFLIQKKCGCMQVAAVGGLSDIH